MSEMELVEAVRSGDRESVSELIAGGADVNQQDKQGWTPLNWAAGKGDLEMIQLLLRHGARPTEVGRDLRTPAMIALAAGQAEAVRALRQAEAQGNGGGAGRPEREYFASYHLGELRRYPAWAENRPDGRDGNPGATNGQPHDGALPDEEVVFLHQDYIVTKSIWRDEDVIFNDVTEQWKDYCRNELQFAVPDDLDLIARPAEAPTDAA